VHFCTISGPNPSDRNPHPEAAGHPTAPAALAIDAHFPVLALPNHLAATCDRDALNRRYSGFPGSARACA